VKKNRIFESQKEQAEKMLQHLPGPNCKPIKGPKMITIKKISSNKTPIGIEIKVGQEKYFIAANQNAWPGIRLGEFPAKGCDQGNELRFDDEEIFSMEESR
jgi:hypothetical protein